MDNETFAPLQGLDDIEIQEWLESLDSVLESSGRDVALEILERLRAHATVAGVDLPFSANTPYANTIPVALEPAFPGDQELERRIKSPGSLERARHGRSRQSPRTQYRRPYFHIRIRCHSLRSRLQSFFPCAQRRISKATPFTFRAMPRLACIRGRFSKAASRRQKLENFRRELKPGGGLSSYPHPWLMPDFWEFPTVSMGLGPADGDLSGPLQPLPGRSRPQACRPTQKFGRSLATVKPTSPNR